MRVADAMASIVTMVPPTLSLAAARRRLSDGQTAALLVVDDDEQLLGIVTEWDLAGAWPSEATSLSLAEVRGLMADLSVAAVMTRDVVWVAPATALVDAGRLLRDHRITALPVLADRRVVGLLADVDLARAFAELA